MENDSSHSHSGSSPANLSPWSLSQLSIQRHIGVIVLMLAVVVLGCFFISTLQVDLLPAITYPRIGVRVETPGITPEIAVEEITKPLEEALSATEGVLQVYSQTREGRISVDLFFEPGGNIDQALNDATATLNRARDRLPDELEQPRLFKFDPSQLPVYEMALTSPSFSDTDLRVFADEELSRELGIVPGVSSVNISGASEEEIRVNLDLSRMQALGISVAQVLDAIRQRNQDVSGGRLTGSQVESLTRTEGKFQSVPEIRALLIATQAGSNENNDRIPLSEIATVQDVASEQRVFVSLNQSPAIKVSFQKQPDANSIQVVDRIKAKLETLRQQGLIPADMVIIPTLDESIFIRNAVRNVVIAGGMGTLLAAIAVLFFLGSLRQTLIIILAIPLASLSAIILMRLFNFSLNVFSLGGLALGVGIVVDNSIVMLESIVQGTTTRHPQRHEKKQILYQAARSSQAVESALIASTSTNLVAVLPFLLLGGFIALLFNELLLTISFAIAASILVALTVVPMLTARLLTLSSSSGIGNFWLIRGFQQHFERATLSYGRRLEQVLHYRWLVVLVAAILLGSSSLWMLGQLPQEILPPINTGQASLSARFPRGTTLETNLQVMELVDEAIAQQPETQYAFTTAGGSLFGTNVVENPARGGSSITLKPGSDIEAFNQRLNQQLEALNLVDIRLQVSPGEVRGLITSNSPLRGADIDVVLQGDDPQALQQAGRQILQTLDEQVSTAQFRPDNDPNETEVQIRPDWDRASALGLTAQNIGETIQTAINGTVPSQLQRDNRLVDIRVQLDRTAIQTPEQILELPMFTGQSRPIRLADVATLGADQAPPEIQRINQRPVFMIAGNLSDGARLSRALADVKQTLATVELPAGVALLPSSAATNNAQLQRALSTLGGLAIFLVFVVMAVQYNSFIDPFIILLTVPFALAGGILGLYVTKTPIGATVIVGAVLLVGIVVNNAIILVELANQIRDQTGVDRKQAILQAAPQRLRPILMTTITTVLGMFPLALGQGQGAEFLQPLGVVVFSGLSFATVLTLFMIPCFYLMIHEGWRLKTKPSQLTHPIEFSEVGTPNRSPSDRSPSEQLK